MRRLLCVLGLCVPGLVQAQTTLEVEDYVIEAPSEQVARSRAHELRWSARVFQDLFARRPPPGRVILSDQPNVSSIIGHAGAKRWTLPWYAGALPGVPKGMAHQVKALTHEAAHLQLIYWVNDGCAPSLKAKFRGYGSYLPDWIDEAVAVYHEPEVMKRQRRLQLRALKHIRFARYFSMLHPIGGEGMQGLPEGLELGEGGVGRAKLRPGAKLPADSNTFYVQSLAVLEYLVARGGKPFVRFCVHELQRDRTMTQILQDWHAKRKAIRALVKLSRKRARKKKGRKPSSHATRTRGQDTDGLGMILRMRRGERVGPLPRDLNALERDWLRWVRRNYPRHDPGLPPYPKT